MAVAVPPGPRLDSIKYLCCCFFSLPLFTSALVSVIVMTKLWDPSFQNWNQGNEILASHISSRNPSLLVEPRIILPSQVKSSWVDKTAKLLETRPPQWYRYETEIFDIGWNEPDFFRAPAKHEPDMFKSPSLLWAPIISKPWFKLFSSKGCSSLCLLFSGNMTYRPGFQL